MHLCSEYWPPRGSRGFKNYNISTASMVSNSNLLHDKVCSEKKNWSTAL